MALEPIQQLEKILTEAKKILILTPENPDGDAIGSAWAFYFFLQKKGSDSTIVISNNIKGLEKFNFLARPEKIVDNISGSRDFILSFKTSYNKITNVRTEKLADELRIYITPERGSFDPRDFSFVPAKFKYDAVIVLDASDKETLGKTYEENPDIFYEVPVINIDHHSNNDNFGQINFVDITASSTAEILASILEQLNSSSIDENIANCLLAGIIIATESFQNKNTTPKAFQMAAKLMGYGANQQEIIRYLYKTQPFHLLKLWGRIMARLKWDEELKLAWASVPIEDFVQSRSTPQDIPAILEKIQDNYSAGKMFLVLYNESPTLVKGLLNFSDAEFAKKLTILGEGKVKRNVYEFEIKDKSIEEAEKEILDKLKS